MKAIATLSSSIYDTFVYAGSNYFRYTIFLFLIFWVGFQERLAHFRIQPRKRTKTKVILREVSYNFSTFVVIGVINWFVDTTIIGGERYGLFYNNNYPKISDYGWIYLIASVFLMLIIEDTYFYWTHRFLHHPKLYHYVHKVHHYSVDPTPFATYSFHPLEATILFFGYRIVPSIIPVHFLAVDLWLLLTLLNSIVIHLGYEIYPRWFTKSGLFKWKTPSTHHNMHHEKVKGNYALIFTWWDKWMGTEFHDYRVRLEAVQQRKMFFKKKA